MSKRRIATGILSVVLGAAILGGPAKALRYEDVAFDRSDYGVIKQATVLGLMRGVGDRCFAPESLTNRGELAQALYNRYGTPVMTDFRFVDVDEDAWCADAIAWANESKVMDVISNGKFAPEETVTREQVAAVLYGMSGRPEMDVNAILSRYSDLNKVSEWARQPVAWAVKTGILSETGPGLISANKPVSRTELAEILVKYVKRVEKAPSAS